MNQTLFDKWARNYEKDIVRLQNEYPFVGYFIIIEEIKKLLQSRNIESILDIGVGSGFMLNKILNKKIDYFGIDFSDKMLDIAKSKFDKKKLIKHNIKEGVPYELKHKKFDIVLSAYTLHHFNDNVKVQIIESFLKLSNKNLFVIADISFDSKKHLLEVKNNEGNGWDAEEEDGYFIEETFNSLIVQRGLFCTYKKISHCSAIYLISNESI